MSIQILRDRVEWWIDQNPGWWLSNEIAKALGISGHFDRNRLARVLETMEIEGDMIRMHSKSKTYWTRSGTDE